MPAAVIDPYANALQYRARIHKSDTADDATVEADLLAVSRWIDRKLGRFFTRDAAPVVRTYYPHVLPVASTRPLNWAESENPWRWGGYSRVLNIDDLSSTPTSIQIDENGDGIYEVTLAVSDYILLPENAQLGPEPRPYEALLLAPYSSHFGFQSDKRVQITGRWGWPQVPEAIIMATCELTAIWRLDSPRATSRVNEMEQAISTSKLANACIDDLMRHYQKIGSLI